MLESYYYPMLIEELTNPIVAGLVIATLIGLLSFDKTVVRLGQRAKRHSRLLNLFFQTISFSPLLVLVLFLTPAFFFWQNGEIRAITAITVACSLALGIAFTGKYLLGRKRPLGHLTYIGEIDSSFPSAHTAGSFAAALMVANFNPDWALPTLIFAGLVACSRLYLQFHFFSDVTGGILLAYIAVIFTLQSNFLTFLGLTS